MQYAVSTYLPIIIIPHHLEATDLKQTTAEFYRQQQCTVKEISLRLAHSLCFCSTKIAVFFNLTSLQTVLRNNHEIYLLRQSICSYFT